MPTVPEEVVNKTPSLAEMMKAIKPAAAVVEAPPQAGTTTVVKPAEVQVQTRATPEENATATHVAVTLRDNARKIYALDDVKNQYEAVKRYMDDNGIISTVNDFNIEFLSPDQI